MSADLTGVRNRLPREPREAHCLAGPADGRGDLEDGGMTREPRATPHLRRISGGSPAVLRDTRIPAEGTVAVGAAQGRRPRNRSAPVTPGSAPPVHRSAWGVPSERLTLQYGYDRKRIDRNTQPAPAVTGIPFGQGFPTRTAPTGRNTPMTGRKAAVATSRPPAPAVSTSPVQAPRPRARARGGTHHCAGRTAVTYPTPPAR